MRIVGLTAALLCIGTTAGWAADCNQAGRIEDATSTSLPGPILSVTGGGSDSCSITTVQNILPVTDPNRFVVYRVLTTGHYEVNPGDEATYTVDAFGQQQVLVQSTENHDNFTVTKNFAAGKGPTSFVGDFALDVTGGSDTEISSLDFLMDTTSLTEQQDSFGILGLEQLAVATHLDNTAGLLTGSNQPLEGANEISVIGAVGSHTLGVAGRYNLAAGFSVLGGVSVVDFDFPGARASGVVAAGALRFVEPGGGDMRIVGEVGIQAAPLGVEFSRHYADENAAGTDASGSGNALLASLYAKGGVLWSPTADDDLLFSATIKQGAFGVGSFVEDDPDTNPNLFAADLSGTSQSITIAKVGTDWTHKLGQGADLTASLALGAASGSGATGTVFGVGAVSGAAQTTYFADYGLRVGWDLGPGSRVDGFVAGSSGTGIGTHAQVGADYRLSF